MNGQELKSPHSLHDHIRQDGAGAFSHWGDSLIFSLPHGIESTQTTQLKVRYPVRLRPDWTYSATWLFVIGLTYLFGPYLVKRLAGMARDFVKYIRSLRAGELQCKTYISLISIGIATFVVAIIILQPYENKPLKPKPGVNYAPNAYLSGWNDTRLKRQNGESDLDFATRLNLVIHNSTYHCGPQDNRTLAERVLFSLSKQSAEQGLLTPELRCGLCHQRAYILAKSLANSGLNTIVFGLNGHVVTLVELSGVRLIFDPDYGVGPFNYDEYDPSMMNDTYRHKYWTSETVAAGSLSTKDDDDEYYTMSILDDISIKQQRLLYLIKLTLYFFALLGCVLTVISALGFFKARLGR